MSQVEVSAHAILRYLERGLRQDVMQCRIAVMRENGTNRLPGDMETLEWIEDNRVHDVDAIRAEITKVALPAAAFGCSTIKAMGGRFQLVRDGDRSTVVTYVSQRQLERSCATGSRIDGRRPEGRRARGGRRVWEMAA